MKNLARLVRYAWPYRAQFALSLGCAVMVAMLWFTELGAVYPLVNILFKSQNSQKWVAEKIAAIETEIAALRARVVEIDEVPDLMAGGDARPPRLLERREAVRAEVRATQEQFHKAKRRLDDPDLDGDLPPVDLAQVDALRRTSQVAEAREDAFHEVVELVKRGDTARLLRRRATLERDLAEDTLWLGRYRWLQPRVDRYLPDDSFKTLLVLVGLVMGGVALKGVFLFLQERLVANIMQLSLFDIRNRFFRRTMALDLAQFSEQGSAELLSRFTNDMDSLSQGLSVLFSKVVREPLRIVTCLGGALWLNWRLTLLALVLIPISALTTIRVGRTMKRAIRRSLESMSNIYKILQQTFQGVKAVKAFTMERYERQRFYRESKALYKKRIRVSTIEAMSDPVLELLSLATVSIALLAGSYLVLNHTKDLNLGLFRLQLASQPIQIEDLLTLYAMLAGLSDPIRKLATVHSKIQRAAAAADRICAMMDRAPRVVDKPTAPRLPRHARRIEFEQVGFAYNGRDPVVRGLDLTVAHGETVALVGPNGCGKSTLMNLLPRFWDVQSGAIRVDGHDVRDIQLRSLRAQIGMVTQETILFEGTVAQNIAYGRRHAGAEAIEAAAKRAYAHPFIMAMPAGYDTVVGEGGLGLSGGQRQRIALARAMLRDPAILVLDEATNAVDIQDEALLRKAIEEFSRGRTTFLITHSLGSLQFADRIVLMNAGRVEAVGTDEELRRTSPLYRRLNEIHYRRESA